MTPLFGDICAPAGQRMQENEPWTGPAIRRNLPCWGYCYRDPVSQNTKGQIDQATNSRYDPTRTSVNYCNYQRNAGGD